VNAGQARRLGYRSAGEVAELLGVTIRTVRYYEEQGLVRPVRTDKGTRYYSDFVVQRLEVCVRLAAAGVPIADLRRLARLRSESATGAEWGSELVVALADLRSRLRRRLADVRGLLADLEQAERLLDRCRDCARVPTPADCPDCDYRNAPAPSRIRQLTLRPPEHVPDPADRLA
jgi:DNA-binding transcriptional MerR regulator